MNEPTPVSASETAGPVEAGNDGQGIADVTTRVVVAVAEADGVDPVGMESPLHDWVDPDALDAVVESLERGHVAFEFADHRVRVDADGTVAVDPE